MATVFLALDLRHKRHVALKVLHPELAQTLGPERFQREIDTVARLQHPHILPVHDSGETAGQLWFTMPFVEGESLRDRLRREQQLPVEVALRIATDAARALQYAHEHGVIHRDVKPENLLLTKDGSTLVADFGIARALSAGDDRLTETGISVGTPAYMSPEQAAGDRTLDARTDVYALGAVLYEMLAGEPPFTGPTAQAVIAKRFSGEVPRVRHVRPSVPGSVEQAVTRALAPVPADRFTTAAQFADALVLPLVTVPESAPALAAPSQPGRRAAGSGWRTRTAIRIAVAFVSGLLVTVSVAMLLWKQVYRAGDSTGTDPKRLAVLPFENLGPPGDEYFADGITDAVRGKLASLPGVQVIARGSSSPYKKTPKTPQEVARELDVRYLLTGTVRWQKEAVGQSRVLVSPELVHVQQDGAPMTKWQEPFDAALTDVFQVQVEVAARVAQALDLALGSGQRQQLAEKPTQNLAAYDAYLRGEEVSAGIARSDPATLRRAISYYEQAVALDSSFAPAWARLSQAHAYLYGQAKPTPEGREAARLAAERALALAPNRPEGRRALGDYYGRVTDDFARALEQYTLGRRIAPRDAELLVGAARAERSLGRWEAAVEHLRQAQALDPRSASMADALVLTLLYLRRYPEALQVSDRALALTPASMDVLEDKAMVYLAQGDLAGARAVLRAAPKEIEPASLAAFLGNYWDLFWALDEEQQQLLLRLRPGAFDDNRATWGIVLAQTHALRGNKTRARAYADSACADFAERLQVTPEDAQLHLFYGLALAYSGRKTEAIMEGERGARLGPVSTNAFDGPYFQHQLVRIYLLVGEPAKALDQLEPLLQVPYYLSPGWLKIDPTFAPLRGNPRFEHLVNGP
jgi:serine/threonine protein kinase/tetratricopeptide (TPR) repeat protein